ncbi:hypothetical protein ACW4TU_23415 [Streptomyces sp. QTS52]
MTTQPTDACDTVRASMFYRAPILSESGACILPKGHKGDHRDAKGASWYLIPLVGGADLDGGKGPTTMSHPRESAWTPEPPFRSPRCVLSQHPHCQDSEPRDTGVPGVHYLVCTCACHHPAPTKEDRS